MAGLGALGNVLSQFGGAAVNAPLDREALQIQKQKLDQEAALLPLQTESLKADYQAKAKEAAKGAYRDFLMQGRANEKVRGMPQWQAQANQLADKAGLIYNPGDYESNFRQFASTTAAEMDPTKFANIVEALGKIQDEGTRNQLETILSNTYPGFDFKIQGQGSYTYGEQTKRQTADSQTRFINDKIKNADTRTQLMQEFEPYKEAKARMDQQMGSAKDQLLVQQFQQRAQEMPLQLKLLQARVSNLNSQVNYRQLQGSTDSGYGFFSKGGARATALATRITGDYKQRQDFIESQQRAIATMDAANSQLGQAAATYFKPDTDADTKASLLASTPGLRERIDAENKLDEQQQELDSLTPIYKNAQDYMVKAGAALQTANTLGGASGVHVDVDTSGLNKRTLPPGPSQTKYTQDGKKVQLYPNGDIYDAASGQQIYKAGQ